MSKIHAKNKQMRKIELFWEVFVIAYFVIYLKVFAENDVIFCA
jgi:hypothetical protein